MLTGKLPFSGEDRKDTMNQILKVNNNVDREASILWGGLLGYHESNTQGKY